MHTNGTSSRSNGLQEHLLPGTKIRREEFVRIVVQALRDAGYPGSAESLEEESGFVAEAPSVSSFRRAVLDGNWTSAAQGLNSLGIDRPDMPMVLFLLGQQQYLELLEAGEVKQALVILRKDLAPLEVNRTELHNLSSLIMSGSVAELHAKAKWDGAKGNSRQTLLAEINSYISPSVMIPDRRLQTLLHQAVKLQRDGCLYHNTDDDDVSLYADHVCQKDRFPNATLKVLEEHKDEVWHVNFSHDGRALVSASKDSTAIVWSVQDGTVIHVLAGHKDAVAFVAFSPDDKLLLTCSNDKTLRLWDVSTGSCKNTLSAHTEAVTSCAWLPSGDRFVSGSLDKHICVWSLAGEVVHSFMGSRVTDLAVNATGDRLVVVCHEKKIRLYDLESFQELRSVQETDSITSLCLSMDGTNALVNLATQEIHLWDLSNSSLVRRFTGHKQGRFVIRSSFAGVNHSFVASGSEDAHVYIWNKDHGVLIEVLRGHSSTVNSIASWRHLIASASDDGTVRIWGPRGE
ncbi:WD40-repeat-containing domain protein [Hyaloraphidium curvatum]|nr:WD40-repeat-containing domain protein [Hyaloraphidium curvatum]